MIRSNLLYVLVSSDKDLYLEQAFISMYSAKYHLPDAFASCVHSGVMNIKIQNDNES